MNVARRSAARMSVIRPAAAREEPGDASGQRRRASHGADDLGLGADI
jgi:hypothetical protein